MQCGHIHVYTETKRAAFIDRYENRTASFGRSSLVFSLCVSLILTRCLLLSSILSLSEHIPHSYIVYSFVYSNSSIPPLLCLQCLFLHTGSGLFAFLLALCIRSLLYFVLDTNLSCISLLFLSADQCLEHLQSPCYSSFIQE